MKHLQSLAIATVVLACTCTLHVGAQTDTTKVMKNTLDLKLVELEKPYMAVTGGTTTFTFDSKPGFVNSTTFGAVFGYGTSNTEFASTIIQRNSGGLHLHYSKAGDSLGGKASVESWRFGLEVSKSYGYALNEAGTSSLDLGSSSAGLNWSVLSFPSIGADSAIAAQMQNRFDGLRFGESARASIGYTIAEPVSLGVGFEWTQMYERHMFWYWLMSGTIEAISSAIGNEFVKAVGKSSPWAVPIIHFIVRNGITMGFKALRQNQMNWPFDTAAPLNFFNYSVNVTLRF